jgi:hypothetical protein
MRRKEIGQKEMIEKMPYRIRFEPRKAYGVSMVSGFEDDLDGTCNPNTREIKIRAGMGDKITLSALLHEIIHVVNFEKHLNITEEQTLGLEVGLFKILELNPDLIKLINDVLVKKK